MDYSEDDGNFPNCYDAASIIIGIENIGNWKPFNYMTEQDANLVLKQLIKTENPQFGNLIAFFKINNNLEHFGIYIGKNESNQIFLFNQYKNGGPYQIIKIDKVLFYCDYLKNGGKIEFYKNQE